jgi:hypothetical protein
MLRLFLELWPSFVPLLLYVAWMWLARRREVKRGNARPTWLSGPWFWAVMASFATALVCMFLFGVARDSEQGEYTPPHMEGDRLVPGTVNH